MQGCIYSSLRGREINPWCGASSDGYRFQGVNRGSNHCIDPPKTWRLQDTWGDTHQSVSLASYMSMPSVVHLAAEIKDKSDVHRRLEMRRLFLIEDQCVDDAPVGHEQS